MTLSNHRKACLPLLCDILNPVTPVTPEVETRLLQNLDTVLGFADAEMVLSQLGWTLQHSALWAKLPADTQDMLEAVQMLNRERNRTLVAQARALTGLLAEIDVTPVYLKGMAQILGRTYPDPGIRMTWDVDVLIPADRISDAFQHMWNNGFRAEGGKDAETAQWRMEISHHIAPLTRKQDQAWVDLHFSFFKDPGFLLPANEILAAARPAQQDGWVAHVPAAEHQMIMAIGHSIYRGFGTFGGADLSLRDANDVLALSQTSGFDWTLVLDRFRQSSEQNNLAWYLTVVEGLFGTQPSPLQPGWKSRARGRLVLAAWLNPAWRRTISRVWAVRILLYALSKSRHRMHFFRIVTDRDYRRNWARRKPSGELPDKH